MNTDCRLFHIAVNLRGTGYKFGVHFIVHKFILSDIFPICRHTVMYNSVTDLMNTGQSLSKGPLNQSMSAKLEFYILMTKDG
jgi:hypothetical protein